MVKAVIYASLVSTASLIVGILIGRFGLISHNNGLAERKQLMDVSTSLLAAISATNIDNNIRHLNSKSDDTELHNMKVASWVRDQFIVGGVDRADLVAHQVLGSWADEDGSNVFTLIDADGNVNLSIPARTSPDWSPTEDYPASGTVQAGLVYSNYGRRQDFDYLKSIGIEIRNQIVIARYGSVPRRAIVQLATEEGAAGVVLYPDPQGSRNRDPLNPFHSAAGGADKNPAHIPVQLIGYREAAILLKTLSPDNSGAESIKGNWSVRLDWSVSNRSAATVYNVFGMIYGSDEPDRYVLVGNHLDAGAVTDPSGATAVLVELARTLAQMKLEKNWRPRRTIVFCGWGARVNSTTTGDNAQVQWAKENAQVLRQRAVAYLNLDLAVAGNYSLYGAASPMMHSLLRKSTKKIPNPNPSEVKEGRNTVYDTWMHSNPDPGQPKQPNGADFTVFSHVLGIPSINLLYTSKEPLESHQLADHSMDRGLAFHRAIAQLMGEMVRALSEAVVLPFDIEFYALFLKSALSRLEMRYKHLLESNGASFEHFRKAVVTFNSQTDYFVHNTLVRLDKTNTLAVRRVNDQLMLLERFFIDPHGLPNRTEFNHIDTFVGLVDLLETVGNQTQTQEPQIWNQIKQHLSVITHLTKGAALSLRDTL